MEEIKISEEMIEKYGIKDFDVTEHLKNDELIALYLADVLKDGTDQEFIEALNDVARAKGMNELAKKAGIGRESLYQTLSSQKPRFETIRKILSALNIELVPTVKSA